MVKIILNKNEIDLFKEMAVLACVGGHSQIVNGEKRAETLLSHNLIGQAGSIALNILAFESREKGVQFYKDSRDIANANPHKGDGGQDIIDTNIDIKTSMVRNKVKNQNPITYILPVRPKEFKENWTYVSATIFEDNMKDNEVIVDVWGWAKSEDLEYTTKPFDGVYGRINKDLRPFPLPDIWPSHLKPFIKKPEFLTF